jgi:hypothetical protein
MLLGRLELLSDILWEVVVCRVGKRFCGRFWNGLWYKVMILGLSL